MRFYKKTLKNGLRIITVPMKDNPTVTVLVLVEAGSKYETKDINGLSHFLEHMCFKGTSKRPRPIDIAHELDALGAQSNAFTSLEFTGYYAKAEAKHFAKLLDIVSDVYLNPIFLEKEIEKEKGVIVGEIDMSRDIPMREVQHIFMDLLYGDQPAGRSVLGTKNTVRSMTQKHFLEYRKKHYVASGTIVLVAGDINTRDVIQNVQKQFTSIPTSRKHTKPKIKEVQEKPQVLVKYKKTDQTHLVLGIRSYGILHKDVPVLEVLSGVLGKGMSSRLFQKLREEMGVGYYVRASNDAFTDHGFLDVSAGVDNKRVHEVVCVILEEFKKLTQELVAKRELKKVKDFMIGNMYLGLESSDDLAEFYGLQEIIRKRILTSKEVAKEIKAVTAADIKRVARNIFQNKNLNLALIGPFRDKKAFSKILKL